MPMSRGAKSTADLMRHSPHDHFGWIQEGPLDNPLLGIVEVLIMGEVFVSGPLYGPVTGGP